MAMTKPYSLQAPEEVAKEYGGDKRKIQQAAVMGIIDPTSAVLAGMFIDRMRGAVAQEQAPTQTVAEQVLSPRQPIAGLEAMPQTRAPEPRTPSGGVADLPVPESMYNEDSFAGGGIVAFAGAGSVEDRINAMLVQQDDVAGTGLYDQRASQPSRFSGLQDYIKSAREAIASVPRTETEAYREYLKGAASRAEKQKGESFNEFLISLGSQIASGTSPNALSNISAGAAKAAPALVEAAKNRRAAEEATMKARADLERQERAEELKAIEMGEKMYQSERDRLIAAGKPTDMRSYVADFVTAAREAGDTKTPESVLKQRGADKYLALYGASQARAAAALTSAGAAATQAGVAGEKVGVDLGDKAEANIAKSLENWNSPYSKELRNLQKQDKANKEKGNPTTLAKDYYDGLIAKETERLRGARPVAPPVAAAPAASAAPTRAVGASGSTGNPLPMPKTKAEAVEGKAYQTARGVAIWDGANFIPVR
jgi:hypothetical protein